MKKWLFYIFIFCAVDAWCQDTTLHYSGSQSDGINYKKRQWLIGGVTAGGYGGSFILLSQAWYNEYQKTSFHTFNDAGEWLQVDKVGHGWTAYQTSRVTTNMWRWAGVENRKAVALGTGSSFLYLLGVEYLDGRSSKWGWSWGDVGANFFGASLYAGQELGWNGQKLSLKFSSKSKSYNDPVLARRADGLYGGSFQERLLKDYNAQTYWLTANIKSFLPKAKLPPWLNIAIGYGAEGMFGGYENLAYHEDGSLAFDRRDIKRYRQWFLAPDVDLTKIKTKSKFLKSAFSAINVLKFPAPALELSNGRLHFKAIAF